LLPVKQETRLKTPFPSPPAAGKGPSSHIMLELSNCTILGNFITPILVPGPLVVIRQLWPCWSLTVLALKLPLPVYQYGVHSSPTSFIFHQLFTLSSWGSLETKWGHSDDALALISVPEDCIVLASGLFKFFKSVQRLIITHGGTFVFSHNVPFHHHPRWDLSRKYRY
jgi:hypothetical protein